VLHVALLLQGLTDLLTLCWFGDLSATVTPLVGDVIVGDVQITNRERPPVRSYDFEGHSLIWILIVNHNRDEHRDTLRIGALIGNCNFLPFEK